MKSLCCAFALCCFLLLPRVAFPQDFSSISGDLDQLESLIASTLANMEQQQSHLEDLKASLDASGSLIETYASIIAERESLLQDLQTRLGEMSAIYRTQSDLSAKYEKSSRFWRTFTLIAVPAAVLLSGGVVYAVTRG